MYVEEVSLRAGSIAGVPTSTTAFVGETARGRVAHCTSFGEFTALFGDLLSSAPLCLAVELFFANGGREAVVTTDGLESLADETFQLLNLADDASVEGLAAAASFCRKRRAFLLADLPAADTTADDAHEFAGALRARAGEASADLALYGPWVKAAGTASSSAVAPGGAIAGIFARTDVWRPPSGTAAKLAGVAALARPFKTSEIDWLTAGGVNCLRALPGGAPVVWGARTLAGAEPAASEWKYVPVRRLALHIEESLDQGLQWVVFEPIGEPLFGAVRKSVADFMDGLFRQGALVGDRPGEAYFVRCDRTTMTQDDIDQGRLIVEVGFAALRPAEFVVLRFCVKC